MVFSVLQNQNREHQGSISMVFPHVQMKMCWEKIICYKGISTRFFYREQDEINAYRGTSTNFSFLDVGNPMFTEI